MCFTKILRVSITLLVLPLFSIPLYAENQQVTITVPNAPEFVWISSIFTNYPMQPFNPDQDRVAETRKLHLWWKSVDSATSYNVYRGEKPGEEGRKPIARNIRGTGYVDTHLKDGAIYYYRVTAVNKAGESAQSQETSRMTHSAPRLHDARADFMTGENGVTRMEANLRVDTDLDKFGSASDSISYKWKVIGKAPGKVEFILHPDYYSDDYHYWSIRQVRFSAPGIYKFRVMAIDSEGLSDSTELSVDVKPISVPNAPDYLWISPINPFEPYSGPVFHETRKLHLWWRSVDTATGYNIYRGDSPGGEGNKPVARNIRATDYVDTHLKDGVTYYYRISAVNDSGESAQSREASGITRSAPQLHDARVEVMPWEDGIIRTEARLRVDAAIDCSPESGDLTYYWTGVGSAPGKADFDAKQNRSNGAERYWSIRQVRFSAPGTYTFRITAKDKEGLSSSADLSVIVKPVVTGLQLSPENAQLAYNESRRFSVTARDQFGKKIRTPNGITWTASSSAVTVDPASGIVTAANFYPGNGDSKLVITAATPDNRLKTSASVKVIDRGPIITQPASIIPCDNSYTPLPKSKPMILKSKPMVITSPYVKLSVSAAHDSGNDHINYRWEIVKSPEGANMNIASSEQTSNYQFIKNGDYTFRVIVGDQNGKSVSTTIDVASKILIDSMHTVSAR